MKKYFAIILALAMVLCLCACTTNNSDQDETDNAASVSESNPTDGAVDDDVVVVDPDNDTDEDNGKEAHDAADEDNADDGDNNASEAPKRTQFSDADKEAAKSAAVTLMKNDCLQEHVDVYELKVTDLYNCVITAGYKVTEDATETLFLSDYDLHYEDGQWVKTASYNRGSFDTSLYKISYSESGALVIAPKQ